MYRKIALVITAAALSVPVGAAVAGSPAFAATRTHAAVSVDKQHNESLDASKDTAKEGSGNDISKDTATDGTSNESSKDQSKEGSSNDTSKDTATDGTSIDASPGADLSVG